MNLALWLQRHARTDPERTAVFVGASAVEVVRPAGVGRGLARARAAREARPRAGRSGRAGDGELARVRRDPARGLVGGARLRAGERQAASAGGRVHPGEFGRERGLRHARLDRRPRRGDGGPRARAGRDRGRKRRLRAPSSASRCPRARSPTTRWPGSSTPAAPPAGPRAPCSRTRNLRAMTQGYLTDVDAVAPGDCLLHAAPMSHGSGLYLVPYLLRRRGAGDPRVRRLRSGRDLRAGRRAPRASACSPRPTIVRRLVEHAAARAPAARGAAHARLRRRADVRGGPPARARRAGPALRADLRPGREPDDDHRARRSAS